MYIFMCIRTCIYMSHMFLYGLLQFCQASGIKISSLAATIFDFVRNAIGFRAYSPITLYIHVTLNSERSICLEEKFPS